MKLGAVYRCCFVVLCVSPLPFNSFADRHNGYVRIRYVFSDAEVEACGRFRTPEMVKKLEDWIDKYDKELPELNKFILSGGVEVSTLLHVARAICRKAERRIVSLKRKEEIDKNVLKYMNRLSDYLFTAARLATHRAGKEDHKWIPKREDSE